MYFLLEQPDCAGTVQPGCDIHRIHALKKGCNAGKPCRIRNIGRPINRVTMRPFSGLMALKHGFGKALETLFDASGVGLRRARRCGGCALRSRRRRMRRRGGGAGRGSPGRYPGRRDRRRGRASCGEFRREAGSDQARAHRRRRSRRHRHARAADSRSPRGVAVTTCAEHKRRSACDRRHHEARHPERSIRRAAADAGVRPRGGRRHARRRRRRKGWCMDALRLQGGQAHRPQVVNYRRDSRRHRSFSAVPFSYPPRQDARSHSPRGPRRAGITLPVLTKYPQCR
ncbi:hypothetical protein BMA2226 [Burkholderia mallei ATCC 23344]|uniref:Uncharacterized protein n=1 Tax=Burkholderia mallei (strain ATCC 23344) TaxID=243160 RepID=A0A0H2WKX2_BURMA|nr:hypothetical protein BMA2226 [Burkholderia mallei ATCC 23344]